MKESFPTDPNKDKLSPERAAVIEVIKGSLLKIKEEIKNKVAPKMSMRGSPTHNSLLVTFNRQTGEIVRSQYLQPQPTQTYFEEVEASKNTDPKLAEKHLVFAVYYPRFSDEGGTDIGAMKTFMRGIQVKFIGLREESGGAIEIVPVKKVGDRFEEIKGQLIVNEPTTTAIENIQWAITLIEEAR